jgi:hypothetical protein
MVKKIAKAQALTTAFIDGREFFFEITNYNIKNCRYTMTAIQLIKGIGISSKFEQLTRKKGT